MTFHPDGVRGLPCGSLATILQQRRLRRYGLRNLTWTAGQCIKYRFKVIKLQLETIKTINDVFEPSILLTAYAFTMGRNSSPSSLASAVVYWIAISISSRSGEEELTYAATFFASAQRFIFSGMLSSFSSSSRSSKSSKLCQRNSDKRISCGWPSFNLATTCCKEAL
jgi:hypothetical protein